MRNSIRFRFTLIFIGLLVLLLATAWITNNWWLESFYINEKVKVLEKSYNYIDALSKNLEAPDNIVSALVKELDRQKEMDDNMIWDSLPNETGLGNNGVDSELVIYDTIRQLGEKSNVRIVMIDTISNMIVRPSTREDEWLSYKVQRYAMGYHQADKIMLKNHGNYLIEKTFDARNNSNYLESWGFLSDNTTLFIMSMPLASVQDSVALSNRFLKYVGITVLLLGSVLMYFTAQKITLPIMKLAKLSEEMSCLNFEARYEGDLTDEIGILGRNMNILSEKLKNAIVELRDANQKLQQDIQEKIKIDEIRKEFIGDVSHELKTPIALIQGYAEGLAEGLCENEDSRKYYCEVVVDEAKKMNTLVQQLLNLTSLEFSNDALNIECFDVVTVIRQLVMSANILIRQSNANVTIQAPKNCFVLADEFKMEEVLNNYLNNALNHLAGERNISIQVTPQEKEVIISVFNSGANIPEESLPNIWSKFYKVDKARTREYGGSGIGLSIVKAIIEAHNKSYGVINRTEGVEFWFTMDLADSSSIHS